MLATKTRNNSTAIYDASREYEREYKKTHPWITFKVDLQKVRPTFWMMLSEAQSKSQHVAGVPLLPSVAQDLYQVSLVKGVLATNAIEGNTLTEDEVFRRLKGELELPPSKEYLGQEVDNIIGACYLIGGKILNGQPTSLCIDDLKEYNRLVLKDLPLNEDVRPGEICDHSVGAGRYRGAPAQDCEYLLERFCEWLNDDSFELFSETYNIASGILKAIVAHIYMVWIHPFGDGNGRTARLVEFQILLSAGVPTTAAHLLSNHYNETRAEYYRQLDQAHQSGGDIIPFIEYALQGYIDGLKEQIEKIIWQQLYVHWINHIHSKFSNKDGVADRRRRRLALDLSNVKGPVPMAKLRHITPRIAEAYADKTYRTIQRDVRILEEMELVEKTSKGVDVRIKTLLAFLPPTR